MKYKRGREVAQSQISVMEVCTGREALCTSGVSTCICILAKGQYGAHSFIAMQHWDGFSDSFDKQATNALEEARAVIDILVALYVLTIKRSFSRTGPNEKPLLEEIRIIGGEKGTPYLSGTELEVETLKRCLPELCETYFQTTPETVYDYKVYLTDSYKSHSNTVIFTPIGVGIISDDLHEKESTLSEKSTDPDSDDFEENLPRRPRFK